MEIMYTYEHVSEHRTHTGKRACAEEACEESADENGLSVLCGSYGDVENAETKGRND